MLAFKGGDVEAHGLPEGCSGQSGSRLVAAMRHDEPSLSGLPVDVLRRLLREATEAIAEALDAGTGDEAHIKYMRDVQRQCRDELVRRGTP